MGDGQRLGGEKKINTGVEESNIVVRESIKNTV